MRPWCASTMRASPTSAGGWVQQCCCRLQLAVRGFGCGQGGRDCLMPRLRCTAVLPCPPLSPPACLPAWHSILPNAAAGWCCRREEELRTGPNLVSLEPPPPGCDRGKPVVWAVCGWPAGCLAVPPACPAAGCGWWCLQPRCDACCCLPACYCTPPRLPFPPLFSPLYLSCTACPPACTACLQMP